MHALTNFLFVTLKWSVRDRIFHALLGTALLLFLLVPAFSLFSMRQVQELSITLSLSAISFALLVFAVMLGASSVWRDLERRYSAAILGLPISRASYILGKFAGIAFVIISCALLLGVVGIVVIAFSSAQYPSERPIHWLNIMAAITADSLKYILLAAVALLLSTLSTSFFLPFFGTIAIFLAGSASQEVFEYISGDYGHTLSSTAKGALKAVYYFLPNFGAFNLKVEAIYGLELSPAGLLYTFLYFLVYTTLLLSLSVWTFSRRDLP
jgi:Cu-processing system permease protein